MWQNEKGGIDDICGVVCYILAQCMKGYTPWSMTDKALGLANPPKCQLWFLWVKLMENGWVGENSRFGRCSGVLWEREGRWFALDTFTERTMGAFSSKPVSWAQGWSSGEREVSLWPFHLSSCLSFLSTQLVSIVLPPNAQCYHTAPGPCCKASLPLIITTVYWELTVCQTLC